MELLERINNSYFSSGLDDTKNVLDISWFNIEIGLSIWIFIARNILINSVRFVETTSPIEKNSKKIYLNIN